MLFQSGSSALRRALIAAAIGDIARARGMSDLARETGLTHDALNKDFRKGGNPTLGTLAAVVNALGFKLGVSRTD